VPLTGAITEPQEPGVPPKPGLIVLTGPTGSGKSGIAARAAQRLKAEIVCADSRQLYRAIPVTSAQPTAAERSMAPHHLYEVLDPGTPCSAGGYLELVRPVLEDLGRRGRVGLIVGGSGFYLRALLGGTPLAPPAAPATLARLHARLRAEGVPALRAELERCDPDSARKIHAGDTYRLVRALAVFVETGKPRSAFPPAAGLPGGAVLLALEWPRPELYARINGRCEQMLAAGALDEARALRARGLDPGDSLWRSIGMPHLCAVLDGTMTRNDALTRMQQDSRNYAKRQLTWLRAQEGLRFIQASDPERAVEAVIAAANGVTADGGHQC